MQGLAARPVSLPHRRLAMFVGRLLDHPSESAMIGVGSRQQKLDRARDRSELPRSFLAGTVRGCFGAKRKLFTLGPVVIPLSEFHFTGVKPRKCPPVKAQIRARAGACQSQLL
jgi:hypothetical protein